VVPPAWLSSGWLRPSEIPASFTALPQNRD
jgi:hypothetical protein